MLDNSLENGLEYSGGIKRLMPVIKLVAPATLLNTKKKYATKYQCQVDWSSNEFG